jgi:hypothetical protein
MSTIAWHWTKAWLVMLLFGCLVAPALGQPQANRATPANVSAAISKGVEFLISEQIKEGGRRGAWDGYNDNGCGQTCLVTLALLSAGREVKSIEVAKALTYIRATKPKKTYEASLKVMVLCLAEPSKDMNQIKEIVDLLVRNQAGNGGWGYEDRGDPDESNTQFAVLALWEASKLGISIPDDCFKKCEKYWRDRFTGEGWCYRHGSPIGSMTCAGIASMTILQDAMAGVDATVKGNSIQCCGGDSSNAFDLDRPMNWLARNFSVTSNPHAQGYTMYYLYALERVGRLTGQRMIGNNDWYREGAEYLIMNQNQSVGGLFRGGFSEANNVTSTAMALLFLSKGKRQVVIGHLQHGDPRQNDWQHHRRAIQNLTGNIEKVWKRELAWQHVRLENATVESLLETPVLFISGSKEFVLNDAQRKLLKDYVEQGGFIFAEACNGDGCKGEQFDLTFRREMETIFDQSLQKLAPTHPIWTAEKKVNPSALPKDFWLYGIDACCRTSVVYSPISLSCRWELARPYGLASKLPAPVEGDIQNAVTIGLNAAAYATGRELKERLDAVSLIPIPTNRQSLARGSLMIPKILHAGGADDAPKAVSNLLEMFRRETQTLTESKTPTISVTSEELEKYPLVYIHGRNKFAFSEAEREGLRKHFENAGFVMGDSICASKEFSECVHKEFSQLLPDSTWRTLAPKHEFLKMSVNGGFDLDDVTLIDKQVRRQGPAEIEVLEWQGRIVMMFSPNDLSCAMESKHSMQCRGYTRNDAFKIGINMILYSMMQTDSR